MNYGFGTSYALLWLVVAFQGLLIVALLRKLVEIQGLVERVPPSALSQLARGSKAPPFTTTDIRSKRVLSLDTFAGGRGILLFLSSSCGICTRLASDLTDLPSHDATKLIVACKDEKIVTALAPHMQCAVESVADMCATYRIARFPTAVIIDESRTVVDVVYPRAGREIISLSRVGDARAPEMARSQSSPQPSVLEAS